MQRHLHHRSNASSITHCSKRCQTSITRCFTLSTSWTCCIYPHIFVEFISMLLDGKSSGEMYPTNNILVTYVALQVLYCIVLYDRRCLVSEGWLSHALSEQKHCQKMFFLGNIFYKTPAILMNLIHRFRNKFASKWCKRFPPHLNSVSTLPCETWNAHCTQAPLSCYRKPSLAVVLTYWPKMCWVGR